MNLKNLQGYSRGEDGQFRLRQTFAVPRRPGVVSVTFLVRDREGNFLRAERQRQRIVLPVLK